MRRSQWMLLAVVALAWFNAGTIWVIQFSCYPLWRDVGKTPSLRISDSGSKAHGESLPFPSRLPQVAHAFSCYSHCPSSRVGRIGSASHSRRGSNRFDHSWSLQSNAISRCYQVSRIPPYIASS